MSTQWIEPVAFSIGPLRVHWYGVWLALGFVAAAIHWSWLARRDGRPRGFGSDFAFLVMVTGILGGRIAHVAANLPHYMDAPREMIRVDQGGLIFYGGFLLAVLSVIVFARLRKDSPLALLDFGVTGLALGHAFGRVGCFFNGCCYGIPAPAPWGVLTAGQLRLPVQLYEVLFNIVLYVFLTRTYLMRRPRGTVLALYLAGYGAWRFAAEFMRGDVRQQMIGLHTAQVVSVACIAAGLGLYAVTRRKDA